MVSTCGLAFIPVALVVMATLLLSTTYTVAVAKGDVAPFFPYLSFMGAKPPECFIFSYLLYVSSLLVVIGAYVRYKLVLCSSSGDLSKHCRRLNAAGFILSVMAAVGMSIVATVRITEVYSIHMLGAGFFFWPSAAYCILQTVLSYLLLSRQRNVGIVLCRLRLFISLLAFSSIFTLMTPGLISAIFAAVGWSRFHRNDSDKQHWQRDDGGYEAHLVSAFTEWSMVSSFVLYFLTFAPEFCRVRLKVILVPNNNNNSCFSDKECFMGEMQNGQSYYLLSGEGSEEEEVVTTDGL